MTETCKIRYYNLKTYILWFVEFCLVFYVLSLVHECLHGVYSVLTGGQFGKIGIMMWVLFIPVFYITCSGGNTFLVIEGTLLTSWFIALLLVILTSFNFLKLITDYCRALNLSGELFGVQLGAVVKAFGEAVYALPNFMFPDVFEHTAYPGDGTVMYFWFISHGYPGEVQYFIAFLMMLGAFCALVFSLRCHEIFCSRCSV